MYLLQLFLSWQYFSLVLLSFNILSLSVLSHISACLCLQHLFPVSILSSFLTCPRLPDPDAGLSNPCGFFYLHVNIHTHTHIYNQLKRYICLYICVYTCITCYGICIHNKYTAYTYVSLSKGAMSDTQTGESSKITDTY